MFARFFRRQKPLVVGPGSPGALIVGPAAPITIGPGTLIAVSPQPCGAWEEKGWTHQAHNGNRVYRGYFQATDPRERRTQRFSGRIIHTRDEIRVYIANPPAQIRFHPKGPCFSKEWEAGWFRLHWHHPAPSVDDAILYTERILAECLGFVRSVS